MNKPASPDINNLETSNIKTNTLETAVVEWDEQGLPMPQNIDDFYFSTSNGLEETRHTFLEHNRLAERWSNELKAKQTFTIAETGFGTGLNFLCAWQLFLETAPDDVRLHFISVEKAPLKLADLKRCHALWPELEPLSKQLHNHYPQPQPGLQRRLFDEGRIQLTLLYGDVQALESLLPSDDPQFDQLGCKVDAWFLDGFTPSRNPDMWQETLFQLMARFSDSGTSVATFTSARIVQDGLRNAGFSIKKHPGYGLKRHMLSAQFGSVGPESDQDQRKRKRNQTIQRNPLAAE